MKLKSNSSYAKIGEKFKPLFNWSLRKQSVSKSNVSTTVLDKRTPFYVPFILLLPALILIFMFTIVPMIYNIINSFSDSVTLKFTLKNYIQTFSSLEYAIGFRNSFIYGILVLPFVLMISLVISSVIAKLYRKWARGFWQTVFFMPYITNGVAISLTFIQVFEQKGVLNQIIGTDIAWLKEGSPDGFHAVIALIINGVWSGLAFNILIFTTAMLSVDKNLYHSASIDGTGGVKQFFSITLPSIKSTINFLITLGIIGGIKVFPLALFENKPTDATANGASTLMLYIYQKTQEGNIYISGASSIALFIIGVTFSSIIRGGFFAAQTTLNYLGERNVWVKVEMTKHTNKETLKKK
ncbi:sugar ABC transporter permease [Mycoplasma anserisalpingitidis]|uniref:Sugar ABC transporter permease n=1 Tax=Mycoplasma anserisalpingitidis TaxID=519450 RepID=A0A5B8JXR0_9MOLU|nr:sugar ABC transporter permease [Mycoplasma anserisalpingitidis]QDY87141.1 sugar ABC transporter permease [Mycoplasma anserisalpingitidis]